MKNCITIMMKVTMGLNPTLTIIYRGDIHHVVVLLSKINIEYNLIE